MTFRTQILANAFFAAASLTSLTITAADKMNEQGDDVFIVKSRSFMASHPDLNSRSLGMQSYQKGHFEEALRQFRKGAYYADKPSQAMVAEMLWKGEGIEQDKIEAYAWIDLAAERLYKDLVAKRENYWAELSADQRLQAVEKGQAIYAKYGDKVAKRRIENILERGRRNITGSRTGYVGVLKIQIPGPGGMPIDISGDQFYQEKFWKPEMYWKWQSVAWKALPTGIATMGELVPIKPKDKP
jgi:hypothetical protein